MNIFHHKNTPNLTILRSLASATKVEPTEEERNRPIKFSTSEAAGLSPRSARQGSFDYYETPWYQRFVVIGSTAIFMIYFFILREENDIDRKLERSLFESVPGLEETQMILNYKYNLEHNLDNKDIIKRMKELGIKPEDIKVDKI